MLFPKASYQFDETGILSYMDRCYNGGIQFNQEYWSQADYDTRVVSGDQNIWPEMYRLTRYQHKMFNFNRVRRIVEMISGHQRRNRKSIVALPVENADQQTSDQFTKILIWLDQQEGISSSISDAFHGSLVTGLNLLHVWIDYRTDPINGNIRVDNCAYNSFLIDPYFRKQDLSDCNYIWKRSYLTKQECISLIPEHAERIENMSSKDSNKDGKFNFMPENFQVDTPDLIKYDEFYYKTYRKAKFLNDAQTGEVLEWTGNDRSLKDFIRVYPQVSVTESLVPTVKLAIVVQGIVVYNGENYLSCDNYPFVPVLAYYNPQLSSYSLRLQGVVRGLRDAQFLYNRRKVIELDILESQRNSGYIVKEGTVVNPDDLYDPGQGKALFIKRNANLADIQRIESPAIPPTTIELSKIMGQEINEISGVNEESLGSATDDKAGILIMLRQGASLTTLMSLFDRLDFSQKLLGKLIIKAVQKSFTPYKVERITEQQPTEQFFNKHFGKYDVAIEEGINTPTQKQMALAQALHLKEVGIPIPDSFFIENMVIQNKTEIIEQIKQEKEQQQQQEQMAQQIQLQEVQSRTELAKARVEEQLALANQRNTQSSLNIASIDERQQEAAKDYEQSHLNKLKALSVLDEMDISKLQRLIEISKMLEDPSVTSSPVKVAPTTLAKKDNID